MNYPVFDLHCDTALALCGDDLKQHYDLSNNHLHIDLERAGKLDGYAQCFACFTTDLLDEHYGVPALQVFEREVAMILYELEKNHSRISQAYSPEEIEKNLQKGKMSAILTIEGPAGFGYDPDLLEDLYKIGFRITTLGWNEKNPLVGSHKTGGGLTDLGRAYVKEAQRLGMIVDVSHISDEGFWDIMQITSGPIIASHSNSRAVCPVSRNLTDDMFKAICQTGGVAGINMYTEFLGENATLNTVCDHILHFLSLDPDGTHIALGGDLDGCDTLPMGFAGVQDYPLLAFVLFNHGLQEQTVRNVFWNNAMGVMKRAICNNKK